MYWFLIVRKDLNARRGDLSIIKGLRIGAAPGPVDGLKRMLAVAGIDPEREVKIGPVPGAVGKTASFGLMAAKALEEGKVDGFWANGMGAEVAVMNGTGTLVLDARREGGEEARGTRFLPCQFRQVDLRKSKQQGGDPRVKAAQQILKGDPGARPWSERSCFRRPRPG